MLYLTSSYFNHYSHRKNTLNVKFHTPGHSLRGFCKESQHQKYFLRVTHDLFCNVLNGFGLIPKIPVVKNSFITIHETIHHVSDG